MAINKPVAISLRLSLDPMDAMLVVTDDLQHSVRVPFSINGLRVLKAMLIAKELDPAGKIGTTSMPTQQMVNEFLKGRELEKKNEETRQMEELKEMF